MSLTHGHVQAALCVACTLLMATAAMAAEPTTSDVRNHADQSFQQLHTREQGVAPQNWDRPRRETATSYNADQFLIGQGQGDLNKGKLVCQRVSELAARADIAKQIRVQVKEHATDRMRERTGREIEQDIEVVREEIVQEYLQGVTIVDRRTDEEAKTCSAVAAMPKTRLHSPPTAEPIAADSPARR